MMAYLFNLSFIYRLAAVGIIVVTELQAQLQANSKGKLTASSSPVYASSGSDARITWNYFGDIPQKIVLRAQLKNTSETLDLWTITVLNSGNDKRIEENRFLHQTKAKSLTGRTYAEYSHNQFELIVEKFTNNDTRFTFVCVVEFDTFNSISSHVDILIEVPPVITSFFGGTRRVPRGGIVDLQCTATGSPAPQLEWKKSSQIRSSGIGTVNLIMERIQPSDTGTYTCNAVNQAGTTEKSVAITVTYIEIDPSYLRVRKQMIGSKAKISCPVLGYPEPTYKWERDGVVVGGKQALDFNSIDSQDFSTYRCVAKNIAGSHSITIELANKETQSAARGAGNTRCACPLLHLLLTVASALILLQLS